MGASSEIKAIVPSPSVIYVRVSFESQLRLADFEDGGGAFILLVPDETIEVLMN